jgi:hypothetical protein
VGVSPQGRAAEHSNKKKKIKKKENCRLKKTTPFSSSRLILLKGNLNFQFNKYSLCFVFPFSNAMLGKFSLSIA